MSGYIGAVPVPEATQNRTSHTATAGQTTFAVDYTAGFIDVFLNGIKLANEDFTATNGSSVVLAVAASVNDILDTISYTAFNIADTVSASTGGTMTGNLAYADNVKATFGNSADLEIFHNGSHSILKDSGTGNLKLLAENFSVQDPNQTEQMILATPNGSVNLYHNGNKRIETTASGIDITGTVQADQYNNDEALPDIRPSLLLDFANSKTLDPRITFTRGSTASYYDGKTTAKAEQNLFKYSQDFDNSYWNGLRAVRTANQTTAPDGTTTADAINQASGETSGGFINSDNNEGYTSGITYTTSIYAKPNGKNFLRVMTTYVNGTQTTWFNLSTGAVGTASSDHTSSMVGAGNGWYRCIVTATADSDGYVNFYISDTDGASTVTDDQTGYYAWGAQVEQRSAATAYTPTTTAPIVKYQPTLLTAASGAARFDHSPTTGESKGLLIEEARTNLFTYSVDYSHSNWNRNNSEVDDNVIIAPDGTLTGGLLKENTASGTNQHNMSQAPTVTTQHYTMSGYFKEPTIHSRRYAGFTMHGMAYAGFDIQAGTTFNYGSGLTNQTITDVGNGWYYCTATWLKTNTNAGAYIILLTGGSNSHNYEVDGTKKGMHIWGAQLEAGSFPTSYIPTSGSSATRAADAAAITGSNFDFFSSGAGTIYSEHQSVATVNQRIYCINDGSNNNTFNGLISTSSGAGVNFEVRKNGVGYAVQPSGITPVAGQIYRLAAAYSYNDVAASRDGNTVGTDTSVITPEVNQMLIGSQSTTSNQSQVTIKKIAIYPKRLPNATLQAMTME